MKIQICTDGLLWDSYLDRVPEVSNYHYWRWRNPIQETFGHEPHYLVALDDAAICGVLPLVLIRSRLFGASLVSMPFFTYGGVVADRPEARNLLLAKAAEIARDLRVRRVELRQGARVDLGWAVTQEKVTMEVALPERAEALLSSLSSGMRNKIRYGPKHGLSARWGGGDSVAHFYPIFAANMRNLGTPVYSRAWFENLCKCDPEIRVLTLWDRDRVVAGAFLVPFRDTLELPWSASLPDSRKKYAHVLMYWTFIEWAIQHGFRRVDLGRCTPGGGTYEFKQHWGCEEKPLHWYHWTPDGEAPPALSPANPRYTLAVRCWQRLPLPIANCLGPLVARSLP